MIELKEMREVPWNRGSWHGSFVSVDGTLASDFTVDDVEEVVSSAQIEGDWDGMTVAIVRLKDGRFAGWESSWDCTGSGFSEEAYGGGADVLFAATADYIESSLSERALEILHGDAR
jgi:hypothetical protein